MILTHKLKLILICKPQIAHHSSRIRAHRVHHWLRIRFLDYWINSLWNTLQYVFENFQNKKELKKPSNTKCLGHVKIRWIFTVENWKFSNTKNQSRQKPTVFVACKNQWFLQLRNKFRKHVKNLWFFKIIYWN